MKTDCPPRSSCVEIDCGALDETTHHEQSLVTVWSGGPKPQLGSVFKKSSTTRNDTLNFIPNAETAFYRCQPERNANEFQQQQHQDIDSNVQVCASAVDYNIGQFPGYHLLVLEIILRS